MDDGLWGTWGGLKGEMELWESLLERDGMGYMVYKGWNLVLCFETYSNLCDCKRTLPSFVM